MKDWKEKLDSVKEKAENIFFEECDMKDKDTRMKFQACFYLLMLDSAFVLGFATIGVLYFLAKMMSILASVFMVIVVLAVIAACISHVSSHLPDDEELEDDSYEYLNKEEMKEKTSEENQKKSDDE